MRRMRIPSNDGYKFLNKFLPILKIAYKNNFNNKKNLKTTLNDEDIEEQELVSDDNTTNCTTECNSIIFKCGYYIAIAK